MHVYTYAFVQYVCLRRVQVQFKIRIDQVRSLDVIAYFYRKVPNCEEMCQSTRSIFFYFLSTRSRLIRFLFLVPFSNASLPNIRECCSKRHVDPDCITKMCDVSQPPSAVGAFDIALTCRNEFPQVAPCLAGSTFILL